MDAIRGLSKTSKGLDEIYTQLASGSRINKASDDAAGLAIASKLNADSRVYGQGIKNINDGISVLQIASNAITSLKDITIRRQELAEQSANGVYSDKQRESLNKEFFELSSEFQRIIATTQFNGLDLFQESGLNGLSLQLAYSDLQLDFGNLFDEMKTMGVYNVGYSGAKSNTYTVASLQGGYSSDVALGDLNGDGILDMVVTDYGTAAQCATSGYSNTVSVSMGNGDGTFGAATFYELGVGTRPHNVSLADVNGDGQLDILADTAQNDVVYVLQNQGNGVFNSDPLSNSTFNPGIYVLNGMATGDINGDGNTDIISTGRTNNGSGLYYGVFVATGNGTGVNGFSSNTNGAVIPSAAFKIEVGKLNGDDYDDVITANRNAKSFSVLYSNGSTLNNADTYNVGAAVNDVAMGDLDGDGRNDIAVAAGNNVYVYTQNSNGTFTQAKTLEAGKTVTSVEIADVNGDGSLDIVSAQGGDNTVNIFMGDGSLGFNKQTAYIGNGPVAMTTGDLNNDGLVDAVIANSKGSTATAMVAGETYLDISTQESARGSLGTLDDILSRLSLVQGKIGALESRLETAVNVMQVSKENFVSADSAITDVDVAEATAKMVRLNILEQASSSVLAHSHLQADIALQLLSFSSDNNYHKNK